MLIGPAGRENGWILDICMKMRGILPMKLPKAPLDAMILTKKEQKGKKHYWKIIHDHTRTSLVSLSRCVDFVEEDLHPLGTKSDKENHCEFCLQPNTNHYHYM